MSILSDSALTGIPNSKGERAQTLYTTGAKYLETACLWDKEENPAKKLNCVKLD